MCKFVKDNNIAVLKSMVSEVTSQHSETQRARAFSLLQVVFGLGGIVGASLGGTVHEADVFIWKVARY